MVGKVVEKKNQLAEKGTSGKVTPFFSDKGEKLLLVREAWWVLEGHLGHLQNPATFGHLISDKDRCHLFYHRMPGLPEFHFALMVRSLLPSDESRSENSRFLSLWFFFLPNGITFVCVWTELRKQNFSLSFFFTVAEKGVY